MKAQKTKFQLSLLIAAVMAAAMLLSPTRARATETMVLTVTNTTLQPNAQNLIGIYISFTGTTTAISANAMTLYMQIGDGGPWGNPNDNIGGTESVPSAADANGPGIDSSASNTTSPYSAGTLIFKPTKNENGVTTTGFWNSQTTSGSITNQPEDINYTENPSYSQITKTSVTFTAAKTIPATATLLMVVDIDTTGFGTVYGTGSGNSINNTNQFVLSFMNTDEGSSKFQNLVPIANDVTLTVNAVSTPEPASIGLLGILLPGLLLRRRRNAA